MAVREFLSLDVF